MNTKITLLIALRPSLITPLLLVIALIGAEIGCSDSVADETSPTQTIAKGDDGEETGGASASEETPESMLRDSLFEPGLGGRGGLSLIAAAVPAECVAYPISDSLLLTASTCLSECRPSDGCVIAVMQDSATNPVYYGLSSHVYLVESAGVQFGLIETEDLHAWENHTIATEIAEQLNVLGAPLELSASRDAELELSGEYDLACDYLGVAAFNDNRELVGIRGDADRCGSFTALTLVSEALQRAISGDRNDLISTDDLPREAEEVSEEMDRDEEEERALAEERYEREAAEAEARAPACLDDEPNYCDGDVEMRCVNGAFTAFHCGTVGWQCGEDSVWGIGCHP